MKLHVNASAACIVRQILVEPDKMQGISLPAIPGGGLPKRLTIFGAFVGNIMREYHACERLG